MREALLDFESGRVLIGILGHPFKCPPAPFEGALLLHDQFVERGLSDAVEIRVAGPMAAPVPITKEVSQTILDALTERGIEYVPNRRSWRSTPERTRREFAGGETIPYDLFVGIPVHRAPEVVERCGWRSTAGCRWSRRTWRPASRMSTPSETSPLSRWRRPECLRRPPLGVVAEDIAAHLHGEELERPYEGAGNVLPRVRRRDGRNGRGELPRRARADRTARRAVTGAGRGQGGRSRRLGENAGSDPEWDPALV